MLPCYPYGADTGGHHNYKNSTWWMRMVASYTGLNFHEVGALEYVQYLTYRRDAYIYYLEQTDAGREYLDNAWRMEQTEPDRAALRCKAGRKEALTGG